MGEASRFGSKEQELRRHFVAYSAVLALILSLLTTTIAAPAAIGDVGVIVQETNPVSTAAETLVERLGGTVRDQLTLIGGFTATLPASALDLLAADASVSAATPDSTVSLLASGWEDATVINANWNANTVSTSMYNVAVNGVDADAYWNAGYTGAGVTVALIDTGVAPVEGLTYPGKVINGPDLSFESQSSTFRYIDTSGHGTHVAGIIAGRDTTTIDPKDYYSFKGIAPDARILNVKVAGHDGAVDVSQVIAAIDWVVQHRNDNGMNVRVLNLSFGTASTQSYLLDPLAFAVEQAWKNGIVVVVAAGNDGNNHPLRMPAADPYVIAVGSAEGSSSNYKAISDFSNCGTTRNVDVVAPGRSIVALRNPGSHADDAYPTARVNGRYFLGSGTSQAAAVVSGAAALVINQYPSATPDEVKSLLKTSAARVLTKTGKMDPCEGDGMIDLGKALTLRYPRKSTQTHTPSVGTGSLETARGGDHVELGGVALTGEQDIFANLWNGTSWSTASASGTSWSGGDWNGTSWSGTSWSGTSWSGASWSGTSWSGTSWSGTSWSGTSWSDKVWNGTSWSGTSWSGTSWSGTSWSGTSWLGQSWG